MSGELRVESEERRKPLATGTIVGIEIGIGLVVSVVVLAIGAGTGSEPAVPAIVAAVLVFLSAPFTFGLLWDDDRTSGAAKVVAAGWAVAEPLAMLVYLAFRDYTFAIIGAAFYVSTWLLFLVGLATSRRRNSRLSSGP
jgi:hypothetical protein